MKKIIQFSKFFPVAVVLSAVIIIAGIASVVTRGINFGLDFKPGMIEEIKIANTVLEVTYNGTATVSLEANEEGVQIVVSVRKTALFQFLMQKLRQFLILLQKSMM